MSSPLSISSYALNQLVVGIDFFLQLVLEAEQSFVILHLLLHLFPCINQVFLQLYYNIVVRDQSLVVLILDFCQIFLKTLDL